MRDAYNHRLRLVQYARQHGIKPTARAFATTVPTVRKWLRRFQQHGPSGLREHSRAHQHCPHKTSPEIEQQVLALRQQAAHLWSGPSETRVRSHRFAHGHPAHLARARIDSQTQKEISAQAGSGRRESDLAAVPTNLRRHQGSVRYSAVLAASPEPASASGRIHGAGSSQRSAVLGLRPETLGGGQRRLRRSHSAALGSLGREPARSGLANRQRQRIHRRPRSAGSSHRLPCRSGRQPASCASRPPRTPTRAMSKPCIAWSKMSSSIWKPSPAAANSSPKRRPISSISTSRGRTRTRKIKLPGKSSSGSLLARRSNSACFHPCSWIITSMTQGDTMYLAIPRCRNGRRKRPTRQIKRPGFELFGSEIR